MMTKKKMTTTTKASLEISSSSNHETTPTSHHSNPTSSSSTSSSSSYKDPSTNDLTINSGAALIIADCMGTGILALPYNINVTLGIYFGLFFLVLNVGINLYAGSILCNVAGLVEKRLDGLYSSIVDDQFDEEEEEEDEGGYGEGGGMSHLNIVSHDDNQHQSRNAFVIGTASATGTGNGNGVMKNIDWDYDEENDDDDNDKGQNCNNNNNTKHNQENNGQHTSNQQHQHDSDSDSDAHTFDFIGLTAALFDYTDIHKNINNNNKNTISTTKSKKKKSKAIIIVIITYYTNIFLVLGNYILVMSHAVAAMIGEDYICIPNAGLIASTLMFGLCQFRSMASLGRVVSLVSLVSFSLVCTLHLCPLLSQSHRWDGPAIRLNVG